MQLAIGTVRIQLKCLLVCIKIEFVQQWTSSFAAVPGKRKRKRKTNLLAEHEMLSFRGLNLSWKLNIANMKVGPNCYFTDIFTVRNEVRQGNIFTGVCQSFCLPQCMLGYIPRTDTPIPWQTPTRPHPETGRIPPKAGITTHPETGSIPPRATVANGTHPTGMLSCSVMI